MAVELLIKNKSQRVTPLLWGELSSASENNVFLLNALLFVFFFLFVFVFCRGLVGSSPLVERRSLDLA
jgi:hypothetical protein